MEISKEIKGRIEAFARELANECGEISAEEFGSPFEVMEVLGAELGDSIMREFVRQKHLIETQAPPAEPSTCCPDCGATGTLKKLRPRTLQTIRGDIEISEPEYHCHSCRRSFFPDGPLVGRRTRQ